MKPSFHITADGLSITDIIKRSLISITVRDEPGIESDSLRLQLTDDPPMDLPEEGTILRVALGYEDRLIDLGAYATRPGAIKGPTREIAIEASVIDRYPEMKEQKRRSWSDRNLKDIVSEIAKEQGLTPSVSPSFADVIIPHDDQSESDSAFLTRMAKRFDALFKIQEQSLIFFDRESKATPAGSVIEPILIEGIQSYELKIRRERVYTGVRAYWWSHRKGQRLSLLAGNEGSVYELKMPFRDGISARHAASAKLRETKRSASYLSFSMPGKPELFAGGRCIVRGLRPGLDGEWDIQSTEHTLSNSGFITTVTCEGMKPL